MEPKRAIIEISNLFDLFPTKDICKFQFLNDKYVKQKEFFYTFKIIAFSENARKNNSLLAFCFDRNAKALAIDIFALKIIYPYYC